MGDCIDSETLISLVENKPVLWDKTLYVFKDRYATRYAWREICKTLNPDFEQLDDFAKDVYGKDVVRKWANIRDSFIKSNKKMREYEHFGGKKPKAYVYEKQLRFLNKLYRDEKAEQNEEDYPAADSDCSMEEANPAAMVTTEIRPNKTKEERPNRTKDERLGKIKEERPNKLQEEQQNKMKRRRENDEVKMKILSALENKRPDSRLSFLHSLMPHLDGFDDDEMLQFQMNVLQAIVNIKRKRSQNCNDPATDAS